ncbi:hypothetical protein [Azospirillum thermophilum]|uniref:Uncharacterized protein n=1 Tax=Azospirillum thermophilum TaxID=2202148 RepID=A0A2S2CX88_9PROT|nr:hypothetical protein [Azospirillum thermophilum]AWK89068.1 hypothetical protein DEW08_23935 [Azospirillum thermophilum]
MNADTGNEPESPKKRGRIPQSAWPQILERYRNGSTLSAIAREFECTPSAISYIIRKAEASGTLGDSDGEHAAVEDAGQAAPETVAEAASAEEPAAPPAAEAVQAEPAVQEAKPAEEAPAAPARAPRQRLTASRAAKEEAKPAAVAEPAATPAPAAPAAPVQQETLRLNRPEPTPPPAVEAPAPAAVPAAASATGAEPAAAGRPSPTPPVDAVEGRLRDTAKACISAYRSWRQQPSEATIQSLSDTVHELRKALARIEIDMSASRREEQAIRPIPIPAHRASRRTQ